MGFPAAGPGQGESLQLRSDPLASYEVIELRRRKDKAIEMVTRREAPSGILYAKRAIDCRAQKSRQLGFGSSYASMQASRLPRKWTRLDPDSVGGELASWACAQAL